MQNLIRSRWSQIHDDMDVRGRVAGHVNYAASSCCRQQIRQHIRVGKKRMMRPIIGLQTTCTCIAIVFRQYYHTTDVFTATGITYLAHRH